jgi:phage gp29-like protein
MPANPTSGLVDQFGRPIQTALLTQRFAGATISGVRQAVHAGISRGLTPQRLAALMHAADLNNPEALMELAEEIEEKDLHYASVLGTRKRQVAQLDMTIETESNAPRDQEILKATKRALIDSDMLSDYVFDMLDAVGKGFSLGELMWKFSASEWSIESIEHVDPRFLRFDRATMSIPRLIDNFGQRQPLAPYKFVFLELKAKSGIPVRGGLIRPAAWSYLFKNFTLKGWVQFCDVYGLPLRVGKFPPGATEDDKAALLAAVSQIGVDAAGIIPENMMIDFVETANKGSSADFFKLLIVYCDEQISKAVLGQTGTTDATPGKLGGQSEHNMVREDIERADAKAISAAVNRQIVRAYVDLNFGPQLVYPRVKFGRSEQTEAQLIIDAVDRLGPQGLKVRAADVRASIGMSDPDPNDETIGGWPAPPANPFGAPGGPGAQPFFKPGQNAPAINAASSLAIALAAQQATADAIDKAAQESLGDWQAVIGPPVEQILALAAEATSLEDFKLRLAKLYPAIDMTGLAEKLASVTFQAFTAGYAGDGLRTP